MPHLPPLRPTEIAVTMLAQEDTTSSGGNLLVPIALVFVIFYLLVIRPGSRERKAREAEVKALKKHDKVVTNAGIHGTVVALDDTTVVLRVDDKQNVRIKFSRAAIWQVERAADEKPEPAASPAEAAS